MGRWLSELQRFILSKAAHQQRVYSCEILADYFGWEPLQKFQRGECTPTEDVGVLTNPGEYFFSRQAIGEREYNRVMATLSRSCRRLEKRGLVTRIQGLMAHWAGVKITEEGKTLGLTVNSEAIDRRVNH